MFKRICVLYFMVLILALSTGVMAAELAAKVAVGQVAHFTIDKNESKDVAIQLGANTYYVLCDIKRVEEKPDVYSGSVDLLKTNGSKVQNGLLRFAEIGTVGRVGKKFTQLKPLAARLRFNNTDSPIEVWLRVVPAKNIKFIPFAYENSKLKPLGIGTNEGKGGTLDKNEWAYHSIKLPAGKWDVSLYFKGVDGVNTNLSGQLDRLDPVGLRVTDWRLNLNEIGKEARVEKRLTILKEQNVLFVVSNTERPSEYIIGIEKATD